MAKGRNTEAIAIYQALMEQVDTCFDSADVSKHAELIYIPHHIRSRLDNFHIRTPAELEAAFTRYITYARELGSVRSRRVCQDAKFRTKDKIEGTHTLEFFDEDGALVTPVTLTTSIIMRVFGQWMICSSEHTSKETTGIQDAVRNAPDTMPPRPLPFVAPKMEKETND